MFSRTGRTRCRGETNVLSEDEKGPQPLSWATSVPLGISTWLGHTENPCCALCAKAGVPGRKSAQELGPHQDELLGTFSTVACDSVLYFSPTLKCLISRRRQKPAISSPVGKGTRDVCLGDVVSQHFLSLWRQGRFWSWRLLSMAHRVCLVSDGQGTL